MAREGDERRDLLKLIGGATLFYGIWKINQVLSHNQEMLQQHDWAKEVRVLLLDTLDSNRNDNLKIYPEQKQNEFVRLVSDNKNELMSPVTQDRNQARTNLLNFVLHEHYQAIPLTIDDPFVANSLTFLDMTIDNKIISRLKTVNLNAQANFWLEALYRSWVISWQESGADPTTKDGLFVPDNQSLVGMTLSPRYEFVKLQTHK